MVCLFVMLYMFLGVNASPQIGRYLKTLLYTNLLFGRDLDPDEFVPVGMMKGGRSTSPSPPKDALRDEAQHAVHVRGCVGGGLVRAEPFDEHRSESPDEKFWGACTLDDLEVFKLRGRLLAEFLKEPTRKGPEEVKAWVDTMPKEQLEHMARLILSRGCL